MSQSAENRRLPVVVGQPREERRRRPRGAHRHAAYLAHLLGQTGARRGLKGGQSLIDQAHGAYLGAEWCGSADRRRPVGGLTGASV